MKKLYRSIKFYFHYRRVILKNKAFLKQKFNIDVDWVNRLYTVVNVPDEDLEPPYNVRKADIDLLSKRYIDEYIKELNRWFSNNGLKEFVEMYDYQKLDKFSHLFVIGYSMFRTNRVANFFYYFFLPLLLITSIIILIMV